MWGDVFSDLLISHGVLFSMVLFVQILQIGVIHFQKFQSRRVVYFQRSMVPISSSPGCGSTGAALTMVNKSTFFGAAFGIFIIAHFAAVSAIIVLSVSDPLWGMLTDVTESTRLREGQCISRLLISHDELFPIFFFSSFHTSASFIFRSSSFVGRFTFNVPWCHFRVL